jgi:hypothetical protein
MIFSIAELALASYKLIISINNVRLGRVVIAPFNSDKALLAVIAFFSIVILSISFVGGNEGKALSGISGLYIISLFTLLFLTRVENTVVINTSVNKVEIYSRF